MIKCISTIAIIVTVTVATGCSTSSETKHIAKVMTVYQVLAENARKEAKLRAELRAEANDPGIPRADARRMMVVLNQQRRKDDQGLAAYEKFKTDQQIALAQASAPRITINTGGEGVPDLNTLTAKYMHGSRYGKSSSRNVLVDYTPSDSFNKYRVTDQSFLNQNTAHAVAKAAPASFYRRQLLERSADQLVQRSAEAIRNAAAADQTTSTDTGEPFADPVPGKPGYATSPPTRTIGQIDIRGYAPGSRVLDPYTGQVIRVP
jgi:hypothetical protein